MLLNAFSWTCLSEETMLTVLQPGLTLNCDSGRDSSERELIRWLRITWTRIPHNYQQGDDGSAFSIISSSHMLVKMSWNVPRVSGQTALKIYAERPSIPDALPMHVCLIAFLTSSKMARRSRSSIIAFYGIKSRAAGSTVEGLLNRL